VDSQKAQRLKYSTVRSLFGMALIQQHGNKGGLTKPMPFSSNSPRCQQIRLLVRHVRLWKQQTAPSENKTKAPEHGPVVLEDFDDGWPGYEGPAFVYH
jgi:hypothetical protein